MPSTGLSYVRASEFEEACNVEEVTTLNGEEIIVVMTTEKTVKLQLKGTKQKVTWSSSVPETATVNNGKIVPLTAGNTLITATTADGVSYECTVTVQGL